MKPENIMPRKEMRMILGGEDLRNQRNDFCYSQEYMANQLDISQSTYQRLESGEIKISIERLLKIAEIFGTSIETLISDNKIEKHQPQSNNNEQTEKLESIILQQEKRIKELEIKLEFFNHPNIATKMTRIT